MLRVNKQKCVGCQACLQNCPGATKIGVDGKAEIIDQKKLEKCGGESICPTGAIEKVSNKGETKQQETPPITPPYPPYEPPLSPHPYGPPPGERGLGRGRGPGLGRGMGAGSGRGLGRGPRDGRGGGGRRN